MMTIKEFASLCGCNTQTLRYYDKIDLLRPVRVDQWTGYRYYERAQAIAFVKIKNLQAADFTIGEIKKLLTVPDSQVYEAFEEKIAAQTRKLERIKEIQQSYLTEMNIMKNLIDSFCDHLLERAEDPRMLREFNMTAAEAGEVVAALQHLLISRTVESGEEARKVTVMMDDQLFEGEQAMEKLTFLVQDEVEDTVYLNADNRVRDISELAEGLEPVWEVHGWDHTHTFLQKIPLPEDGRKYTMFVRHCDHAICESLSYPLFLIGALLMRGHEAAAEMACYVDYSSDGQNHFVMMCKK